MKQNNNENAANRYSYVGNNYSLGEKEFKNAILNSLPEEWSKLHKDGYIHIHDLDAYGQTYNCLTFDLSNFDYSIFKGLKSPELPILLIQYFELLIENYGNEQSGGMSFANWDDDLAEILIKLGFIENEFNLDILRTSIKSFILWCNGNHNRMGLTSYYVTLNIGLAKTDLARFIAKVTIEEFKSLGPLVYKPNLVFKVHGGVNRFEGDKNFDLLNLALDCTSSKMMPNYLLCDCEEDKLIDPRIISVMGCRTRVVDDLYGKIGSIGRGNIDNISINLPRLAFEINKEHPTYGLKDKIEALKLKWSHIASITKDILLDRFNKTCRLGSDKFPQNSKYNMWCENFNNNSLYDVFKHGTLSIGFIGLSEMIEILSGKKYWEDESIKKMTLEFVKFMRNYCDSLTKEYKLNFSLLATSGELISGRFTKLDSKVFTSSNDIIKKGFYTNSFHVEVDSRMPAYRKLMIEGPFHKYCNGGSISYVELKEAPLGNIEGLKDLMEIAIQSGVHYLGFNFPMDVCNKCKNKGVFDKCTSCGSIDITRIRRVSGYLEILDGFTDGKKAEVKNRRPN